MPSIYEEGDRVPTHLPLSSHHPMINGLNGLCGQGNPVTPLRFSKVAVTAYSWVCVIEEEDDELQSPGPPYVQMCRGHRSVLHI